MKSVSKMLIVVIFVFLYTGVASAAFDDIIIGARPAGMGGAFVALSDDTNAPMYNPAGMGYMSSAQVGFTHLRMFAGAVNYNYASVILPLNVAGSFGVSFGMLGEDSGVYSERTVAFSYAKKLIDSISLGINLKMLNTGFDDSNIWVSENPYFVESSVSAFTADLGILIRPVSGLNIGLASENLIPADISISETEEEKVPINIRFGLAYNLAAVASSAQQPALKEVLETTTLSIAGASRKEYESTATKISTGIEAWFAKGVLGLRAGYKIKKLQQTASSASVGASIKIPVTELNLQLDYALQLFGGDVEDNAVHRVSLALSL
ncbi:PorV/PorQ family protein [Candidatus Poribacteria bacterium]|nr:PorV/PorQ family protein [Candidatus Poribacteria bacterium]